MFFFKYEQLAFNSHKKKISICFFHETTIF